MGKRQKEMKNRAKQEVNKQKRHGLNSQLTENRNSIISIIMS